MRGLVTEAHRQLRDAVRRRHDAGRELDRDQPIPTLQESLGDAADDLREQVRPGISQSAGPGSTMGGWGGATGGRSSSISLNRAR